MPCASTMAQVLNRMGYGLRKVVKAKPQKKFHKPMISSTTSKNLSGNQQTSLKLKPLSMDCKATVNIRGYSRGGKTRGDNQAEDHDMGCTEKYTPCGIIDEISLVAQIKQLLRLFLKNKLPAKAVASRYPIWATVDFAVI